MQAMRQKISVSLVLVATLLLLAFKVLPHHHHTFYLPEVEQALTSLHFAAEHCDDHSHDEPHTSDNDCPSIELTYIDCKGVEATKSVHNYDFSPVFICQESVVADISSSAPLQTIYKIPKIPDSTFAVVSLRAPPVV